MGPRENIDFSVNDCSLEGVKERIDEWLEEKRF
jgi:hypothetical protein